MGRSRKRKTSHRSNPRTRSGARSRPSRGGSSGGVTITSVSPVGNISGYRPMVQATVTDSQGTLSKDDINVFLDGEAGKGLSIPPDHRQFEFHAPQALLGSPHGRDNGRYRRKQERQEAEKLELRRTIHGLWKQEDARRPRGREEGLVPRRRKEEDRRRGSAWDLGQGHDDEGFRLQSDHELPHGRHLDNRRGSYG